MAIQINECEDSPKFDRDVAPVSEHKFTIVCTAGEGDAEAEAAFRTHVDSEDWGFGLPLQRSRIERLHAGLYMGYAIYGTNDAGLVETGDEEETFTVQSDRRRILTAISQTKYGFRTDSGIGSASVGDAIGVSERGVEGAEILIPRAKFSVSKILAGTAVDNTYKQVVGDTVGRVNDATFRGYEVGEVLLEGAYLRRRTRPGSSSWPPIWEARFDFLVSRDGEFPYPEGLEAGPDDPELIPKPGWAFFWVHRETKPFGEEAKDLPVAVAAYVAVTYEEADFSALGITTA